MRKPIMQRLISDDDGHWFVIPVDEEDRFHEWVRAVEDGKKWKGKGYDGNALCGGPGSICFADWESRW